MRRFSAEELAHEHSARECATQVVVFDHFELDDAIQASPEALEVCTWMSRVTDPKSLHEIFKIVWDDVDGSTFRYDMEDTFKEATRVVMHDADLKTYKQFTQWWAQALYWMTKHVMDVDDVLGHRSPYMKDIRLRKKMFMDVHLWAARMWLVSMAGYVVQEARDVQDVRQHQVYRHDMVEHRLRWNPVQTMMDVAWERRHQVLPRRKNWIRVRANARAFPSLEDWKNTPTVPLFERHGPLRAYEDVWVQCLPEVFRSFHMLMAQMDARMLDKLLVRYIHEVEATKEEVQSMRLFKFSKEHAGVQRWFGQQLLNELWRHSIDKLPGFATMWNYLQCHQSLFPGEDDLTFATSLIHHTWAEEATAEGVQVLMTLPFAEREFSRYVNLRRRSRMQFRAWFSWAMPEFMKATPMRIHTFWAPLLEVFELENIMAGALDFISDEDIFFLGSMDISNNNSMFAKHRLWDTRCVRLGDADVQAQFCKQLHLVRQAVFGPRAADVIRRKEQLDQKREDEMFIERHVGQKRSKSAHEAALEELTTDELRQYEVCLRRVTLWDRDTLTVVSALQRAGARKLVRLETLEGNTLKTQTFAHSLAIMAQHMPHRIASIRSMLRRKEKEEDAHIEPLHVVVHLTCNAAVRNAHQIHPGVGTCVLAMLSQSMWSKCVNRDAEREEEIARDAQEDTRQLDADPFTFGS